MIHTFRSGRIQKNESDTRSAEHPSKISVERNAGKSGIILAAVFALLLSGCGSENDTTHVEPFSEIYSESTTEEKEKITDPSKLGSDVIYSRPEDEASGTTEQVTTKHFEVTTEYPEGEVQKRYIFLEEKRYVYSDTSIVIVDKTDMEQLGVIEKENNRTEPNEDWEASHVSRGSEVYRWGDRIYVTEDGYTFALFVEDEVGKYEGVLSGVFVKTEQGDYVFFDSSPEIIGGQVASLRPGYGHAGQKLTKKLVTGEWVFIFYGSIGETEPPVIMMNEVVKDTENRRSVNLKSIEKEMAGRGLQVILPEEPEDGKAKQDEQI